MLKKAGLELESTFRQAVTLRDPPAASAARIAIDELQALSLDADLVAPPEAAVFGEQLVAGFRAAPTSGDHLRMPPPRNLTGPQIRGSIARVLGSDARGGATPEAAIAEAKMRRVLMAIDVAHQMIQSSAKARM